MPPKKRKAKADEHMVSDKDKEAAETSSRLQAAALEAGMYSRARRLTGTELEHPSMLLKADGKDIVKKSTVRKGRYLLSINARLSPAAAGRLVRTPHHVVPASPSVTDADQMHVLVHGTLAGLDSKNPVMYLDFPSGRLKLFGTLVFPKNKYLCLKFGPKEVLCEDVFENMVVFAESWWIGTTEENPEEAQLPMPPELQAEKLHNEDALLQPGADAERSKAAGRQVAAPVPGAEEMVDSDEEAGADAECARPALQRRQRVAAAGKRPHYGEDGISSSSSSESDEGLGAPPPRKLPRNAAAPPTSQQKHEPAHRGKGKAGSQSQEPSPGGTAKVYPAAGVAAQSKLSSFFTKQGGAARESGPKKCTAVRAGAAGLSAAATAVPGSAQRSTPRRASAALAATKMAQSAAAAAAAGGSSGDEDGDAANDGDLELSSSSDESPVVVKWVKRRFAMSEVETDSVQGEEEGMDKGNPTTDDEDSES